MRVLGVVSLRLRESLLIFFDLGPSRGPRVFGWCALSLAWTSETTVSSGPKENPNGAFARKYRRQPLGTHEAVI